MITHTWGAFKFSLRLIQSLQHALGKVFVFADDCIAVPDVHHLLDSTGRHKQFAVDYKLFTTDRCTFSLAYFGHISTKADLKTCAM